MIGRFAVPIAANDEPSLLIETFKGRAIAQGGTFENESATLAWLENNYSLFKEASIVITPNAYALGRVFAIKPFDGSADLTYTRNSTATRINSAGLIAVKAPNMPRLNYVNGVPSWLSETQRANLVFASETATTQTRTLTAGAHSLTIYGTGSVTLSGSATGTLVGTGVNNRVQLVFTATAGSVTFTVAGSVTRWQCELGAFPTSYIPTTTTAVTRVADSYVKTGLGSHIGQTEGTLYFEIHQSAVLSSARAVLFVSRTTPASSFLVPTIYANNALGVSIHPQGAWVADISSSPNLLNAVGLYKCAFRYKAGDYALSVNGSIVASSTNALSINTGINSLTLSNPFAGQGLNMFFPFAKTNAELNQLTTI
jgi:hypothetical protein